ncbi:MAG: glycoside hydrolase family 97 C-terminal domain-containing protein [Bacteroidales bacterium]
MMKKIPVSWDETRFIDGYPGSYIVLARRKGANWFIAGVNAEKEPVKLTFKLPFKVTGPGTIITEGETLRSFSTGTATPDNEGIMAVEMKPVGGFVIKF